MSETTVARRMRALNRLADQETRILHESEHFYVWQCDDGSLCLRLNAGTHSVSVGKPKDLEAAKRFIDKVERSGLSELKRMYSVL